MPEKNRRNYYRLLHVQSDAPTAVIKSSYRTLMQKLRMHPDLGGDVGDAALINEAYEILSDPQKRAEYDRQLPSFERDEAPAAPRGPRTDAGQQSAGQANAAECCPFCHAATRSRPDSDAVCASCSSPLGRPPISQTEQADWVRAVERIPQEMAVKFWTGWPDAPAYSGQLLDVSTTGLRFRTSEPVVPNQFLKIDCERFQAIARVIHAQDTVDGREVGAEFLTLQFSRSRGAFVSETI